MGLELSNLEKLEEAILPIKEELGQRLGEIFFENIERTGEEVQMWQIFIEKIVDRSNIHLVFFKLPGYENFPTLKIGLKDDEEKDENGFILPLTLQEALELLGIFSETDFQTLVEYSALNTVYTFQKKAEALDIENNPDANKLSKNFKHHIAEINNYLAHLMNNPPKHWKAAVQFYWAQSPISLLKYKKE